MSETIIVLLALSGLTAFLALLLETADFFLADYGECAIDINDGEKRLSVNGGGKLLATLMEQGIFIPSACGGRGSCGLCKLKVMAGGGPVLPTETPYLEPEELQAHFRLACQVRVRSDLKIEIPPELFLIKSFRTRVSAMADLTHTIREVELELVDPPEISFKPGQFVQFEVPPYEGSPEPVYRAYSIASRAADKRRIRLTITRVPNGIATTYVHHILKPGDEVSINGPYGDFYLRESDRDMVMIATGSGLAPLISILYQLIDEQIPRKATLFFGVRCRRDLFYQDEIAAIGRALPAFTYVPVLSDPAPDDDWQGETGYVTDALARRLDDGSHCEAYLCGNPFMITAAESILASKGVAPDRIFYDKFA